MKLTELSEAEVTPAIFARYLIVYVDDGGAGEFHIITDIPPTISEEKFQKLYDLSFESGSLVDWVKAFPIDHTDWYEQLGTEESPFENVESYRWNHWKDFVTYMKGNFQPNEDDFSE